MHKSRRGALTHAAAVVAVVFTLAGLSFSAPGAHRAVHAVIPERLADSTFWRIVSTFSEQSGQFPSENFVSNETEWQAVIPEVMDRVTPASAYLGVGPEQNFTYIAAFHPRIAFICDIRRQNLIEHLMYKALIEMSVDRADLLSRLWSRPRPDGLDSSSDATALLTAYAKVQPDSFLFSLNLGAIFGQLVGKHKFALSADDSATLRAVYSVFFRDGLDISYSSSSRRNSVFAGPGQLNIRGGSMVSNGTSTWLNGSGVLVYSSNGVTQTWRYTTDSTGKQRFVRDSGGILVPDTTFKGSPLTFSPIPGALYGFGGAYASFGALMTERDDAGVNRGWLGSETAFQWLRDFESRNLLVPVVGDFAGPKALRAIGTYLRDNGAHVSAFYTSNVEQYLFQNGVDVAFYDNVATLPTDARSVFIRSFQSNLRGGVTPRRQGSRMTQTTSSIDTVLGAHKSGRLGSYTALSQLQDR